MVKKSKRALYQQTKKSKLTPARIASDISNSASDRRKLSWQVHQGDLLFSFTPRLLIQEIAQRQIHRGPGRNAFAFAFHRIAQVEEFPLQSIQSFARQVADRWPGARRVRVFGTRWLKDGIQENRCLLIEKALQEIVSSRRSSSPSAESYEIQIFLARNDRAFVGRALLLGSRPENVGIESQHLGGRVAVLESKVPPSRAYLKLNEALELMGWTMEPSDRVLDLAAAPGGWTWVAVQAGAQVLAVDRAELAPELMRHPRVTFVQGDLFQFQSAERFDWVICDVICEPGRSLSLLERVIREFAPRRILWTLKFKGQIRFSDLDQADRMLQGRSYLLRHLNSNKNEVTIFVDLRGEN